MYRDNQQIIVIDVISFLLRRSLINKRHGYFLLLLFHDRVYYVRLEWERT